jgi:YVTN family beta-propeller protein/VCBS repeat-containing protein
LGSITAGLPSKGLDAAATTSASPGQLAAISIARAAIPASAPPVPPRTPGGGTVAQLAAPRIAAASGESGSPTPGSSTQVMVAAPGALDAPVTFASIASDLLHWLGLGPLAANNLLPAVQVPAPLDVLWLAVRRVGYTFFNQAPTVSPTLNHEDPLTGVITGDLHVVDYDDTTVTVTVTATHGTVAVDPSGHFTYTPDPSAAANGGSDSLTVTVDDRPGNPAHLHGPAELFGQLPPSTSAVVPISVAPVDKPPTVGDTPFTIGHVDPISGVVTGSVNVTDADGDTLSYKLSTAPDPAKGTVTVNASTGAWTYTPSASARLKATDVNATDSDKQVAFTITASDGQASTNVPISTAVTPLNVTHIAVTDPVYAVVSPDGSRVYVTSRDALLSIIDTATTTVTTTELKNAQGDIFNVGDAVITPDGGRLYINDAHGNVLVFDTATNTLTATLVASSGTNPTGYLAIAPDGSHVYTMDNNALFVIDTATDTVTFQVGKGQHLSAGLAISPDGSLIYAIRQLDGTGVVAEYTADTPDNGFAGLATVSGIFPDRLLISPDGTHLYEGDYGGTVSVIDSATMTVTTTIEVGFSNHQHDQGMAISPDGTRLYTTGINGLSVIDTATNAVIATLPYYGTQLAISPDGTHLYLVADDQNDVVRIDIPVDTNTAAQT